MRRREFITALGIVAVWPRLATAQQEIPLIGILLAGSRGSYTRNLQNFRAGMHELGYDEGRNIRFEYRFADNYLDRLSGLAADLISLKPSLIVSAPLPANLAVHRATTTIPIVMATCADPVGFGLITSLAHPGGNVTGLANFAELLASKQLDLLRELLPRLSRVAMLVNISNPLHVPQLREMQAAITEAKVDFFEADIRGPNEFEDVFAVLAREKPHALLVPPDPLFYASRRQIAERTATARLPAIYGYRDHVEDGGLISYGPDLGANYRQAATYVDKILKGAQPADLPVEQPNKIELAINLKTAKELGLDVPPILLARADEVVE